MKKTARFTLLTGFSILILFAVGLGPATAKVVPKGKATCAVVTLQEQTVDPHKFTGALLTPIMVHLNEGLMRNDLRGRFVPGVVQSWKVSEDGLTWELLLRDDVKFSNGAPVTAADVKFSIERHAKPEMKTPSGAVMSRYLKGVEIAGEHRLLVHATGAYPDLPRRIGVAYPIPKATYESVGEDQFAKNPVTCGPFKLVKNAVGESLAMEAFDGFYDEERIPRVKNILLKIIPEASTRLAALKVGEVDIIEGVAGPLIPTVKANPDLKTFSSARTASLFYSFQTAFREPDSPFADKRVRQALNYAIDRDTIIEKLYFGEAQPTAGPFWPSTFGVDLSLEPYSYDLGKAKQLLADAGHADGFDIEIYSYVSSSTPLIPEVSEALAGFLKKLGIKATVTQMEAGVYFGKWREKSMLGLGAISIPASSYFDGGMMLATHYVKDGTYSYFSNPEVENLFQKQKTEMNRQVREDLLKRANRVLYDESSDLFTISVNTVFGAGSKIKNWQLYAGNPYLAGLEYLLLED